MIKKWRSRSDMFQKVFDTKSGNKVKVEMVRTSFEGPDVYDMHWVKEPSEGDLEEVFKALGVEDDENIIFDTEDMTPLEKELVTQNLIRSKERLEN